MNETKKLFYKIRITFIKIVVLFYTERKIINKRKLDTRYSA